MKCHINHKIHSCVTLVNVTKLCYTHPRSKDTNKNKNKKVSHKRSFMIHPKTNRGEVPPPYIFFGFLYYYEQPYISINRSRHPIHNLLKK